MESEVYRAVAAVKAAGAAIGELRDNATIEEIRAVAPETKGSEREEIIEAIRTAVAQQPPGTPQWKLERVRDEVLAPFRKAYERKRAGERKKEEAERQRKWEEFEQSLRRSNAESDARWRLMKVYDDLGEIEEVEFENDRDRRDTAEALRALIQPQLVQEILEHPEMAYNQMDERIKGLMRQHVESMLEE